ncbi:barstar family protein [Streptomyces sp. NPDC055060]
MPSRGTYELFGWTPESAAGRGRVGGRVWLVPEEQGCDPWLLEDAESVVRPGWPDSIVLTGVDDCEGPPEGYRGPVRVHDGSRWLGSCTEFARVLPPQLPVPPLILRGLAPGDQLRAALEKGTRRALDLAEVALEVRDDQGELLSRRLWWTEVRAWRPSAGGQEGGRRCEAATGLIDLELDAEGFEPVPDYARPLWERWFTGPPDAVGAWGALDTRCRGAWLDLVRERGCRRPRRDRPAGRPYELDGGLITDEAGLYLALGEAVNGPGGYFGGCLAALDDCLAGGFGYSAPGVLLWKNAETAREHLSRLLTPDGRPRDLFTTALDTLAEGGLRVTLA